jgi:DNA-binding response OmpR family regulator
MYESFKALVVDDEPMVRDLTSRALTRRGFECEQAANGLEAKEMILENEYDVVVSDFRMPQLNGHRLVAELCGLERRPLVVLVTGVIDPTLAASVLNAGADDIMFKPIDHDVLAVKIRFMVESRKEAQAAAN